MAKPRRRVAAISCTHAPFENKKAIDLVIERLQDAPYGRITDLVMLGDLFESSAASVHEDEYNHTLSDEYEAGSRILERIRKALPRTAKLHWLLGNHDDNLQVKDSRRTDWRTRGLIHWNQSEWSKEFKRWKQYPYVKPSVHDQSGCLQIGQIILLHGYDAGANSDEIEGLQVAYACGGHAWRCIVRGHTHRPRGVSQTRRSTKCLLPYFVANAGTCGPLQPPYMARKDVSQWSPGIFWGECVDMPAQRIKSKQWDAHVEILR